MEARAHWSRKLEYLLAVIGYAVGLGNVWRFPYLTFRSGGGAFLLPFFLMLILCGTPLAYMEMSVGQFTRQGPIGAIGKLCPFFKGAGAATVVISFLFTTYYVIIITWAFYYMFSCFTTELPWTHCNHEWNSPLCWMNATTTNNNNNTDNNSSIISSALFGFNDSSSIGGSDLQGYSGNGTNLTTGMWFPTIAPNGSRSPTEDFFIENVLQRSDGIDSQGTLRWQLLLILMLCWCLIYFCIWKGPKSTGKVVYFTATFPYLVLVILLVRGVTLPGSMDGLDFFIKPRWELLLEAKVWVYAAAQTFNSLGVAFGGLITMSSYSKFNNNVLRDVLALAFVDAFTCVLAGFAIFSILGNLALNQGKSVADVVQEGPGLVFVIYPQAFNSMPVPQLFAVLFFFMLVCLGIDSQFASVEVIVTTIQDHFEEQVRKYLKKKEVLVAVVCFISFLFGLPNITQGGFYFFQLIDYYAAALSLMMLVFFETVAICWFYGARNLSDNIRQMTGSKANIFFVVCWYVISPVLLLAIWIFSLIQYAPLSIAGYTYPDWAVALGWVIALLSVLCIPAGMVHAVVKAKGSSLLQKFLNSFKCTIDESPNQTTMMDGSKGGVVLLNSVPNRQFSDMQDHNTKECLNV